MCGNSALMAGRFGFACVAVMIPINQKTMGPSVSAVISGCGVAEQVLRFSFEVAKLGYDVVEFGGEKRERWSW